MFSTTMKYWSTIMILFAFAPILPAAALLILGEIFDISFMLPTRAYEGHLFWTPEDMFPPKSDEDYRWEEMVRDAIEATAPDPAPLEVKPIQARETIPQGSYGGNSYPTDKEYWEDVEYLPNAWEL